MQRLQHVHEGEHEAHRHLSHPRGGGRRRMYRGSLSVDPGNSAEHRDHWLWRQGAHRHQAWRPREQAYKRSVKTYGGENSAFLTPGTTTTQATDGSVPADENPGDSEGDNPTPPVEDSGKGDGTDEGDGSGGEGDNTDEGRGSDEGGSGSSGGSGSADFE